MVLKTTVTTTPDYIVENHGSILLVVPQTTDARDNLKANAQEGAQFFGRALVVEPRYGAGLVAQLQDEGWTVQ
jgi:hypothetical protein